MDVAAAGSNTRRDKALASSVGSDPRDDSCRRTPEEIHVELGVRLGKRSILPCAAQTTLLYSQWDNKPLACDGVRAWIGTNARGTEPWEALNLGKNNPALFERLLEIQTEALEQMRTLVRQAQKGKRRRAAAAPEVELEATTGEVDDGEGEEEELVSNPPVNAPGSGRTKKKRIPNNGLAAPRRSGRGK
jgi:hypothetical protein